MTKADVKNGRSNHHADCDADQPIANGLAFAPHMAAHRETVLLLVRGVCHTVRTSGLESRSWPLNPATGLTELPRTISTSYHDEI